jgi:hypothetical protein
VTAVVFGFALVGGLIWLIAASSGTAKAKRVAHLAVMAEHLGGQHDSRGMAWGSKLGPKVTYELTTRGAGSSAEYWTHIHVEVPAAYPLALHVRRQTGRDHRVIERGEMVDVVIGDPPFDEAFLIEAAPADVVRVLLDSRIRNVLDAHKNVDLDTVTRDGARCISLGIQGWLEDLERVREPISAMAQLGGRVRDAFAQADANIETAPVGDPYRPIISDEPARAAQASREAEVEKVTAVRATREANAKAAAVVVLAVIFGLTFLFMGASMCR